MNSLLLEIIEKLPPLPKTVSELSNYIDAKGSEADVAGVAKIISKDPLLTAEILRLANSAYYGVSREVFSVQQAAALLGINTIKNMTISNAIRGKLSIDVSPYGVTLQTFSSICSQEVDFIVGWLKEEKPDLLKSLVPCAMLLHLGTILFSSALIEEKKDKTFLEELQKNQFKNISLVESEFFGVDHLEFLGFLFDNWNFDEILIQSIAHITCPHAAPDEIRAQAYALAITDSLFNLHDTCGSYPTYRAMELLKNAIENGVNFSKESFIEKLPPKAKISLNTPPII